MKTPFPGMNKSSPATMRNGSQKQSPAPAQSKEALFFAILENGRKLLEDGKHLEAVRQFNLVLKEAPDNPDAHFLMAKLATKLSATRNAVDHMRKALKHGAGHVFMHFHAANAFLDHGLGEEALEQVNAALKLDPINKPASALKAKILQHLGMHIAAIEIVTGILKNDPSNPMAVGIFAASKKFTGTEPEIAAIEQAYGGKIDPDGKRNISYSLGKIFNDFKDYDKAFYYFNAAAASYDDAEGAITTPEKFNTMRDNFTRELIEVKSKTGHQSAKPVFIVGMPRSGTTLTEQILASHPDACGVGELMAMNRISMMLDFRKKDKNEFKNKIKNIQKGDQYIFGENYLNTLNQYSIIAKKYADKMPHNFINVGLINIIFPNAKIIHCTRNAIDNCVSCYTSPLNTSHLYAKDLHGLGQYYREYWALMQYWKSVSKIEIFEMNYETTVANLEGQARALINYVGLPWNDACLKFNESSNQVSTISNWQVRQPIYSTSVKRWKAYEKHIQPLIEGLGDLALTD
jgi:tetratricopeptide (TPR) repeat protein